jgi:hypothetical protein
LLVVLAPFLGWLPALASMAVVAVLVTALALLEGCAVAWLNPRSRVKQQNY